jgi:aerobic carbon-monoxide dehydrogenase medium subunit
MRKFDLLQPTTVDEAIGILAQHGEEAQLIGGGAMMAILLRQRLIAPAVLVSTLDVAGLSQLRATSSSGLAFGGATTLRAIERAPEVQRDYSVLVDALRKVGNVRVRNVATIGGHLAQADIHMDLPPVLIGYGAVVVARGPGGERRIPLQELFTGYYETSLDSAEIITAVELPAADLGLYGVYHKFCSLSPNDWPTVGVAAFFKRNDSGTAEARVVVGSVSERPLRLPEFEARLAGGALTDALIAETGRAYAEASDPYGDVRGSVEYKRRVTGVVVARAIREAGQRAGILPPGGQS